MEAWRREREALGLVRPGTARKAAQKALLLAPWIGDEEAAGVSPGDIARALVELAERGGRSGRGLAPGTLRAACAAGSQAMGWAAARGEAGANPFDAVERPRARGSSARFLMPEQAAGLACEMAGLARSGMASGDAQRASFALAACAALATGLRRGEVFGLEWGDVDMAGMRVSVARSVADGGVVGPPKSASGARSVAFGANLAALLAEALAFRRRALPPARWPQSAPVVCNGLGERANLNTFEHWWRAWADGNGWEGLRFHDLRHSHATLLIAGGADVKTVQARLGHSSARTTLSVYAHAIPLADGPAAASLDAQLFG